MIVKILRNALGALPFSCGPGGKKWNTMSRVLDPVLQFHIPETLSTRFGDLAIDRSHNGERVLTYSFQNILRHYEKSDLAKLIWWSAGEDKTFIDIGANLGMYSLLARECGFETHLVEPEPRHSTFLIRNESRFGTVHAIGLSNESGELPMYYVPGNSGGTSFVETPDSLVSDLTVPVRVFSDIAINGGFGEMEKISLLKIDVEGHEPETVEGLSSFLDLGHRPMIWAEVRGDRSGRRQRSYRSVMKCLSQYSYVAIDPLKWQIVTIESPQLSGRQVFDLFFVRDKSIADKAIEFMRSGNVRCAA